MNNSQTVILTLENEDENFFVLEGWVQKAAPPQHWRGGVHIFVQLPLSTHALTRISFCHGNVSVYIAWAVQKEFVYVCDSLTIILEEIP